MNMNLKKIIAFVMAFSVTAAAIPGNTGINRMSELQHVSAATNLKTQLIEDIGNYAVAHYSEHKILPSLTVAQFILESSSSSRASGVSSLAEVYHNYFGMKAGSSYKGQTINLKTGEYTPSGEYYSIVDAFRAYSTFEEGMAGYYQFLQYSRYSNLKGVTDYNKACQLIKDDGWATAPSYTTSLVSIIKTNNLTRFDKLINVDPVDDKKLETAVQWAIDISKEESHGYSQKNRQGPDYDCSSLVINALKYAKIPTGGATYTGNMKTELTAAGFTWIPWSQINGTSNLKRGDILLTSGHTEFYIGNNQNVGAHSDYGNPDTGDQNGKEISVTAYWNDNWTGVLRYGGGTITPPINDGCFPACGASYGSLVDALASIGEKSSYDYRSQIARVNGISGYSGKAEENVKLLNLLKAGNLKRPEGVTDEDVSNNNSGNTTVTYDYQYYPSVNSSFGSIVDALISIGVDSSYNHRAKIAAANGINNYTGTASQNVTMLDLLKSGKLKNPDAKTTTTPVDSGSTQYFKKCGSSYGSIVDALVSIGVDSSFNYRAKIAAANSISNYSGTAEQNTKMLSMLKAGTLINPDAAPAAPAVTTLNVKFDADGGTSPVVNMTFKTTDTYNNLPKPSREGYVFEGWVSGSTAVKDGQKLVSSSDHTLKATWKASTYVLSLNPNDGSSEVTTTNVTYGSKYPKFADIAREGYAFQGWYTDISGGDKVTADTTFSQSDNVTLYAHWEPVKINIHFDLNGGEGASETMTVLYNAPLENLETPQKSGYIFNGWLDENGDVVTSDMIAKGETEQTLTADWSEIKIEESDDIAYGDIDGDGIIDMTDLSSLALHLLKEQDFNDRQMQAADATGDDNVDLADLAHLKQYISKGISWIGKK